MLPIVYRLVSSITAFHLIHILLILKSIIKTLAAMLLTAYPVKCTELINTLFNNKYIINPSQGEKQYSGHFIADVL